MFDRAVVAYINKTYILYNNNSEKIPTAENLVDYIYSNDSQKPFLQLGTLSYNCAASLVSGLRSNSSRIYDFYLIQQTSYPFMENVLEDFKNTFKNINITFEKVPVYYFDDMEDYYNKKKISSNFELKESRKITAEYDIFVVHFQLDKEVWKDVGKVQLAQIIHLIHHILRLGTTQECFFTKEYILSKEIKCVDDLINAYMEWTFDLQKEHPYIIDTYRGLTARKMSVPWRNVDNPDFVKRLRVTESTQQTNLILEMLIQEIPDGDILALPNGTSVNVYFKLKEDEYKYTSLVLLITPSHIKYMIHTLSKPETVSKKVAITDLANYLVLKGISNRHSNKTQKIVSEFLPIIDKIKNKSSELLEKTRNGVFIKEITENNITLQRSVINYEKKIWESVTEIMDL